MFFLLNKSIDIVVYVWYKYGMDTQTSSKQMARQNVKLRYDGKFTRISGEVRQWTLLSHFLDVDGQDRFKGSFGLAGLRQIGVVR